MICALRRGVREVTAVEINATYHRRQEEGTLKNWVASVPEGFRFVVKGHRAITPRAQEAALLNEFLSDMQTLGPQLAAMFFQFPLKRDGNEEGFEKFLTNLDGAPPVAFDLKHASWHTDDIAARFIALFETHLVPADWRTGLDTEQARSSSPVSGATPGASTAPSNTTRDFPSQ